MSGTKSGTGFIVKDGKAHFRCAGCNCVRDFQVELVKGLHSDVIVGRAKLAGWRADRYDPAITRCPQCVAIETTKWRDSNAELKKLESKTATMTAIPKEVTPIREPTVEEKQAIRIRLDVHFDARKGMYLNGYSDEVIATEVKVPLIVVQRLRDNSYGPIKVTPEDLAMAAEVRALRKEHADRAADHKELSELLKQHLADLTKLDEKIAAIERKIGRRAA